MQVKLFATSFRSASTTWKDERPVAKVSCSQPHFEVLLQQAFDCGLRVKSCSQPHFEALLQRLHW